MIIEFFWFALLQFKVEEKIHSKAVVDVCRGAGGRVFTEEIARGLIGYYGLKQSCTRRFESEIFI